MNTISAIQSMHSKPRFRLAELLIAVAVAALALVWAERSAWQQITILRKDMNVQQLDHFRSADQLRAAILQMQNLWRRSIDGTNTADQTGIETRGHNVKELILAQISKADSPAEANLLNEIGDTFAQYQSHLSESLEKARLMTEGDPSRALGRQIGLDLEKLLTQTEELTAINRAAAEQFMRDTNATLTQLQRFLLASLVGLLICGAAMIVLIYRRTIAPLQHTLTQSRALIERQEKLASLGVFAAGIAHEIRNPLTAIKVRLFTLKGSHKPDTSEREDLEVIGAEIDRLEHIVRDFLQFARPAEPVLQTLPVDRLLQEIQKLLQSDLATKSVVLKLDLHTNEAVRVDPSKMKQVLINFVQNGAESMASGGTVTLCSRLDKQMLNGHLASVVVIDVADTGSGISPEAQKRLFDPFFTTKEAGTGLGLPIAARIVEKHGGVIQVQTQLQRGTTFSIVLPSVPKYENQS